MSPVAFSHRSPERHQPQNRNLQLLPLPPSILSHTPNRAAINDTTIPLLAPILPSPLTLWVCFPNTTQLIQLPDFPHICHRCQRPIVECNCCALYRCSQVLRDRRSSDIGTGGEFDNEEIRRGGGDAECAERLCDLFIGLNSANRFRKSVEESSRV